MKFIVGLFALTAVGVALFAQGCGSSGSSASTSTEPAVTFYGAGS